MRADKVREIAAKLGRHVAILGDLRGPKSVYPPLKKAKFFLNIGDKFLLDANWVKVKATKKKSVSTTKACLLTSCLGDILLLDDGRVQLKVLEVQGMKVFTEVTVGGPLQQ
ncbi:pyruvate kinase [Escherichia coli]